jgi:predicted RNA binding protein with dsRBD fold (UPF0201 family)
VKSIHGHDAFLMEFEQIQTFLKPVFTKKVQSKTTIYKLNKQIA